MKSTLLILQYINNVEMIENHEWVELKFYKMFCNSISPYCAGIEYIPKELNYQTPVGNHYCICDHD